MSFRKKYFDSLTVLAIIFAIVTVIVIVINNSLQSSEEKRQIAENLILTHIDNSFNQSLKNDEIKNHNVGIMVHNQQVLVHNQQVLLKKGNSTVLDGIRNDTRTDFIPIGNESID